MKVCEICEQAEACVEVKHYEHGELRVLCLCADCAQAHGLQVPANLADLLLESTLQAVEQSPPETDTAEKGLLCGGCGMHLRDFRKSGRLGCPVCYQAFATVLEPMLMGMHRSLQYHGSLEAVAIETPERLAAALQEAVLHEDYETAARLRDRIRSAAGQDRLEGQQREFWFDESV